MGVKMLPTAGRHLSCSIASLQRTHSTLDFQLMMGPGSGHQSSGSDEAQGKRPLQTACVYGRPDASDPDVEDLWADRHRYQGERIPQSNSEMMLLL